MSLQNFWLFLPACFALNMAFGPNNVLSLSNSARDGMHYAILAGGRLLAFAAMIAIAGLGLGALLMASETLFMILKLGGAAYLVWLGMKLLRSAPIQPANFMIEGDSFELAPGKLRRLAKQEFLVAVGNPKAILIGTCHARVFAESALSVMTNTRTLFKVSSAL